MAMNLALALLILLAAGGLFMLGVLLFVFTRSW
jgi:hypothetical protein